VLLARRALDQQELDAIADLEQRVLAVDGGRLKLEWGTLRGRDGTRDHDFLWLDEDRLAGFLGIYVFGGGEAELAGMVDPGRRRAGVGGRLLDAALGECRGRGLDHVLLLVPRTSAGGGALARSRGGVLDHSEHALVLDGEPAPGPTDPAVTVRQAGAADVAEVGRLLGAAFDWTPDDLDRIVLGGGARTLLVERAGRPVGTLRLSEDGDTGSVHGFAVDPAVQGQGIGRDALRRACVDLRGRGSSRVALEVAVDNERALGLYTSIGFRPVLTEDYYRLALR
jgi:ribosomal protein S18 acetylase RimI-like enzyme